MCAEGPSSAPSDPAILVVDDEATMLLLMGAFLRRLGYGTVTVCSDVASARAHLARGAFDLVISDVQMQPDTGLDLLAAIRAAPELAAVRVILMSSSASVRQRCRAQEGGANAYLTKPFTPTALHDAILQVLGDTVLSRP